MSGEKYKIPTILVSALTNRGLKTVLKTHLPPSATVFPHYHSHFSETFKVIEGSISIFTSATSSTKLDQNRQYLAQGQSATVQPGTLHKYIVGASSTTVELTFEPGTLGFERAMCILRGMQIDDPDSIEGDMGLVAVIAQLSDSNPVGAFKDALLAAKAEPGWQERFERLVQQYAKDEDLLSAVRR
ncbi:hypothetical protein FALBO_2347 [Fusarium albosuccineum]|uniref:Cupin 2 conserved barrel domain-containing protein n=1 Tax=Fusarium albosuccineum TaxID=1237068 RepID=A0A8H4PHW8_9HYPO|nr:hypothetical protein FALBO_2347 [Fusarium albosuccineum]